MKIILSALLALLFFASGKLSAQNISLKLEGAKLTEAISQLQKQVDVKISYDRQLIANETTLITVTARNLSLPQALDTLLKNTQLSYLIKEKQVTLVGQIEHIISAPDDFIKTKGSLKIIRGQVVNGSGLPISGASIRIKATKKDAVTDQDGKFTCSARVGNTLLITCVGYTPKEIKVENEKNELLIVLKSASIELDPVTVVNNGMFNRNKDSFTGLTNTVSGKELRQVSRQNILEGLALLDPSFKIIRNNNTGSNPNALPVIEFRGKTAVSSIELNDGGRPYRQQLELEYKQDPNQPLFILDGFETNLQAIMDLDVNRIASVTLLKDAASTALYGSKAANGVIVIETIKPTPGQLRINYNISARYQVADLSGYNMMNAAELINFQEKTGVFNSPLAEKVALENHKNNILRGVNSQWENVVLRNTFSSNHTLSINGGENSFLYGINLNLGRNPGVVKGDKRNTYNTQFNLNYRKNKINVMNNLVIATANSEGSPYGKFDQYIRMPRYYPIFKEDGKTINSDKYFNDFTVDGRRAQRYTNPLYNASLPSINTTHTFELNNNLGILWDIASGWRLNTTMQINKSRGRSDFFISPLNSAFDNVTDIKDRGSYDQVFNENNNIGGRMVLTYSRVLKEKHLLNMNISGEIQHKHTSSTGVTGLGYAPTNKTPLIFGAAHYPLNKQPTGSDITSRRLAFVASANYSYDQRYNMDISYSKSGTSIFGADNPFNSYYSLGLGWNIDREPFFNPEGWVNRLRIMTNTGISGNESGTSYQSNSIYALQLQPSPFGEAIRLSQTGVPKIKASITRNTSLNIQAGFFNNRIGMTLSGYDKYTNPLITDLSVAASLGNTSMPQNTGNLYARGLEASIDARILKKQNWSWSINVNTPLWRKSRYNGFGTSLEKQNAAARNANYLLRYSDNADPDAIWAVRSQGIDPATGKELFLDANDNLTFFFDSRDEVVIGTTRAFTEGTLSSMLIYKNFSLNIFTTYALGRWMKNSALFNKAERITDAYQNQDRRALQDHWQKPGDIAEFSGLNPNGVNNNSNMSDRFIIKENIIDLSSVNFNYDFSTITKNLRKSWGLQSLDFSVNMNEFLRFRLSNVRVERGIESPFTRSMTFSLRAGF